jgi:hypothetical protein
MTFGSCGLPAILLLLIAAGVIAGILFIILRKR